MKEYILCSSVWFDDGKKHNYQPKNINIGFVMCGYRHNSIFAQFGMTVKERKDIGIYTREQGFLTNLNRFVNRMEAAKISYLSGQVDKPLKELYSEDLY